MNDLIASAALGLAVLTTGMQPAGARECRVVHGRYAIYVSDDRLWIVGSKHLLDVVIDDLDKQLEARGWQDTVVYGDFTLCAEHMGDPLSLTTHDRVEVTGYTNLMYRRR